MAQRSYPYLDLVRGLAALAVLFGHARTLFFIDYQSGIGLATSVYFAAGFGHCAVMVFFVLSGFFIGRAIHSRWQADRWNWQEYLASRLSRLWVVLLPALVLTFLCDAIGSRFGFDRSVYDGAPAAQLSLGHVAAHTSLPIFLGNALFLQTIRVPFFGSNGPLWSLANEFWYYMVYPCLVCAWYQRRSGFFAAIWLVAAAGMLWFVGVSIAVGFLIWLGGVAAYRVSQTVAKRNLKVSAVWLWASLIGFAFSLVVARLGILRGDVADFLVGAGTIPLVVTLAAGRIRCPGWLERSSQRLADMSYSLYAVHLPLLVCVSAFVVGNNRWYPNSGAVAGLFLLCVAALIYAYAVYWLFESRTYKLRRWFGSRTFANTTVVAPRRGDVVNRV